MNKILVDTNILIDYSKGFGKDFETIIIQHKTGKILLHVNPIVVAEFLANKNLRNAKELKDARDFLGLFQNIGINNLTGQLAGELSREQGSISLADAFIAASCLQFDLQLYTNNKKDFREVKKIKLFYF